MKIYITFIVSLLSFGLLAQSTNCDTPTPIDLSSGAECVNGTNQGATSENVMYGACNANPANEVWYTYTATGSQNDFQLDPGTMQDAQIVIYTGGCPNSGGALEICDNATGGNPVNIGWGFAVGTQVWVGVMSNTNTDGTFDLCIDSYAPDPSGGDGCAGAIPICDGTTTVDFNDFGASGASPGCFFGAVNQDVWFTFDVIQGGTFEWDVSPGAGMTNAEFDWALYDISGGCPGTELSCNYNYGGSTNGGVGQNPGAAGNCPEDGITNDPSLEYCLPDNLAPGSYAIVIDLYDSGNVGEIDFTVGNGTAEIAPNADFTINPSGVVCGSNVTVSINDNSIGAPDWDFGDGTTFSGNNPPDVTYSTPGTYAITATFGGPCPSTHTEYVELFGPLSAVTNSTDESCPGACDGSASVVPDGGSGNYDYTWTPGGQTTPNVNNLCDGSYDVTITDPVCATSITETVTLNVPPSCCLLTNFTANVSACDPATGTYSVDGTVEFTQPPTTGQLIVEDCNGNQQTFNAPFTSPTNYNLTGLAADGAACDVTAYFSDDVGCTQNIAYTAPDCPCSFSFLDVNISACDPTDNTFEITGSVEFQSPPTTGQLIIEDCNGNQQTFNAPFTSPTNYAITGIDSDGTAGCDLTAYFSDDVACSITSNTFDYPMPCECTADAGTFTDGTVGSTTTNGPYLLCFNDELNITANGDYTPPQDLSATFTTITYDPGMWLAVYSCPPTLSSPDDINNDPCYVGIASTADQAWNLINDTGDNSTFYYVPVTMYSMTDGVYSVSINGGDMCYDLGPTYEVTNLAPITTNIVEDCQAGEAEVTIDGGQPSFDGSNFTISNLQPGSASLSTTTVPDGGTVTISGLVDGDNYSFDIVDDAGCPQTISGTFTGTEDPGFDYATDTYCQDETDPVANITGEPGGTFTVAPAGLTVDPNTGEIDLSSATGTFTITYTTPDPVCFDDATYDVTINAVPNITALADQTVCENYTLPAINGTDLTGNEAYYDAPNGGGNQFNPGDVITAPGTTTFYIYDETGTTPNCFDEETFDVTINIAPTLDQLNNQVECDSYTLPAISGNDLSGNEAYYDATNGGGTQYNPGDNITAPGTTTLYIYDETGTTPNCFDELTVDITINPTPVFTVDYTDPTICGANDGTITISDLEPNTAYDVSYDDDGTTTGPTSMNSDANGDIVISGLSAGSYSNFVVSLNGCTGTDNSSLNLVDPNAPSVNAGPDQEVCEGTDVTLNADNPDGAIISWNNGITDGTPFTPTVGTTMYTVTADLAGCISTDQVNVTVNPIPNVNAGNDVTICEGEDVVLTGSGADSYTWDNGVTDGVSFSPATTTTYTVTGTSAAGCSNTDDVTVNVEPIPSVDFEGQNLTGCAPVTASFTNLSGNAGGTCTWTFGDGSTSVGCNQVSNTFENPGCYDVTLEVTTANGCTSTLTLEDYVCVGGYPDASFTFSPDELTNINTEIDFTNTSNGADSYEWDFGDGQGSNSTNPNHDYPGNAEDYEVELIAYNNEGCTDTAYAVINVKEELIFYVPNTFTPDKDDFNEVFKPVFTSGFDPFNYNLVIFNRWGEIIFESNDADVGWDGTYGAESNRIVKDGTYVWKITYKRKGIDEHQIEVGHVNVLK